MALTRELVKLKLSRAIEDGMEETAELCRHWLATEQDARDAARLDWLEGERDREILWSPSSNLPQPHSLFRMNLPITRAAIDAAMTQKESQT